MSLERYVSILDLWRLRLAEVGEVSQVSSLNLAEPSQPSSGGSMGPRSKSTEVPDAVLADEDRVEADSIAYDGSAT